MTPECCDRMTENTFNSAVQQGERTGTHPELGIREIWVTPTPHSYAAVLMGTRIAPWVAGVMRGNDGASPTPRLTPRSLAAFVCVNERIDSRAETQGR